MSGQVVGSKVEFFPNHRFRRTKDEQLTDEQPEPEGDAERAEPRSPGWTECRSLGRRVRFQGARGIQARGASGRHYKRHGSHHESGVPIEGLADGSQKHGRERRP
jgi:hypothetical protein